MDQKCREVLAESVVNRLVLSGFTEDAQQQAWIKALETILSNTEEEATAQFPKKEQANFRQMLGLARSAFSTEITAYKKYLADVRKGTARDEAANRMRTRLEHQREPVKFV